MKRKIDAMHSLFGVRPEYRCEYCTNLITGYYRGIFLRKCTVYGATHSDATDWRRKYVACGLFDREYKGTAVIEILKHSARKVDIVPIEGQLTLEELTNAES